jgi:Kef-type K+ transport system membrane component KefB
MAAPLTFPALLLAKMSAKMIPLVPAIRAFNYLGHEGTYYALMMSTRLTFGTISALFGLQHGVIDRAQYSHLVATVIGTAIIPTAIANAWFMPRNLLPATKPAQEAEMVEEDLEEMP